MRSSDLSLSPSPGHRPQAYPDRFSNWYRGAVRTASFPERWLVEEARRLTVIPGIQGENRTG
ncbi:MAG: hypothetical protein OXF88_21080 [Rhodobacteraceae bacterium]|nr:hypothetical protein [Paracoccaceae bacterium]MCY4138093.1 hypothetical protein [Paracoccaceae bacterium]